MSGIITLGLFLGAIATTGTTRWVCAIAGLILSAWIVYRISRDDIYGPR